MSVRDKYVLGRGRVSLKPITLIRIKYSISYKSILMFNVYVINKGQNLESTFGYTFYSNINSKILIVLNHKQEIKSASEEFPL